MELNDFIHILFFWLLFAHYLMGDFSFIRNILSAVKKILKSLLLINFYQESSRGGNTQEGRGAPSTSALGSDIPC